MAKWMSSSGSDCYWKQDTAKTTTAGMPAETTRPMPVIFVTVQRTAGHTGSGGRVWENDDQAKADTCDIEGLPQKLQRR